MKKLLMDAIARKNESRPPVWFMRQAGRYHSHYQSLRARHSFMDLCKVPELAREVTMGPIRDFDFDAAILFSDLLFPLEAMGMGLSYGDAGPKLSWHLRSKDDLARLTNGPSSLAELEFQGDAVRLIRRELPQNKGLIGFVGGPLTLFFYAVAGSHKGDLSDAKTAMIDGRWEGFCQKLLGLLIDNMVLQANAGVDAIAIFDTCGGEVDPITYRELVVPALRTVMNEFKSRVPNCPIIYYSKKTTSQHWAHLVDLPIACLGIDWHHDLALTLKEWTPRFAIQGNIDPNWLFLDSKELERGLRSVFSKVLELPPSVRAAWICGLGHGVLPGTPVDNVRLFLKIQREMFL